MKSLILEVIMLEVMNIPALFTVQMVINIQEVKILNMEPKLKQEIQ